MDINIVVLYIMCFSIVIFCGLTMLRQKKERHADFHFIIQRLVALEDEIKRLKQILKIK